MWYLMNSKMFRDGKRFTVENRDSYNTVVPNSDPNIDEIQLKTKTVDDRWRVEQLNFTQSSAEFLDLSEDTLQELIGSGAIEPIQ